MANNLKGYDAFQVLRSVFDVDKNCLRVCVVDGSPGSGGGIEVIINHTEDSIRLGNGTSFFTSTTENGDIALDVHISNSDLDIRNLNASQDNIAIHDSNGDELDINADGSLNIQETLNSSFSGLYKVGTLSALTNSIETTLVTHTAVGGRITFLQLVSVSGDNIAKYRVKINGSTIDTKRTYFGGDLEKDFIFNGEKNPGIQVNPGDIVTVTVEHSRPSAGDFEGRIQYLEVI